MPDFLQTRKVLCKMNKIVDWTVVRNIANNLTNQLDTGDGVDVTQAHMSFFGQGPIREYTLAPGKKGEWRSVGGSKDGWRAFVDGDVIRLYWQSASSGCGLEARLLDPGNQWQLWFFPSENDPHYRGRYYYLYENAERIGNISLTKG